MDKLKVTHFYTVPSVLKQLRKEDETFISQYDLKSLKVISVGVYMKATIFEGIDVLQCS